MTTTPWKNMMRRIYNHRLRQEAHSLWGCLAFGFDIQLFIVFVKLDCHYLYTIYIYIYDERTLRSHFDDRNNMRKTPYQNIVYNIYYIRDWINIVRGCENVSQFSFKGTANVVFGSALYCPMTKVIFVFRVRLKTIHAKKNSSCFLARKHVPLRLCAAIFRIQEVKGSIVVRERPGGQSNRSSRCASTIPVTCTCTMMRWPSAQSGIL